MNTRCKMQLKMIESIGEMNDINIQTKIKLYLHKGYNETDAVEMPLKEAQAVINDMNEKLSKALSFLTVDKVTEIYSDMAKQ